MTQRRPGNSKLVLKHVAGHRCSEDGGPDPACLVASGKPVIVNPVLPQAYTDIEQAPAPTPSSDLPIEPLRDLVILQHLPPETQVGSFVVPQEHQERPTVAVVLARGDGRWTEYGQYVEVDEKIQVGCHVLVPQFAGQEFEVKGQRYTILRSDELMGVLKAPQADAAALGAAARALGMADEKGTY